MLLRLPPNLHYPLTVTKIEKRVGESVVRNDAVFLYSYTVKVKEEDRYEVRRDDEIPWVEKKLVTHYSSTLEGTIKAWRVWEGDVIKEPWVLASCKNLQNSF
jgi:RNA polymerase II subunit A C-terminal domain phosphatase